MSKQGSGAMRGEKRLGLDKAGIIRYETHGERFEILVDPHLAWEYRQGKNVLINDVVMAYVVFEDALRGKHATDESIEKIFETKDENEIVKQILEHGKLNLTTEQKRKLVKNKKNQIIALIARNAINPQTSYPHPPERIERAMDEAKVSIDPFAPAEEQTKGIVRALTPILPIRMEHVKIAIKIPADVTGKGFGIVSQYGKVSQDQWQADGSWIAVVELPAGLQMARLDELNKLSKGRVEIKIITRSS